MFVQVVSSAAALEAKVHCTLLEKQLEDDILVNESHVRLYKQAQATLAVSLVCMVVGMVLSASAIQGYRSFLPYAVLGLSAVAVWRLLSTARLLGSEHARQA